MTLTVQINLLQASTELLAEIFNTNLRVVFKTTTSRGLEFPLLLTVSESTLEPHRTYSVFISRYINITKRA